MPDNTQKMLEFLRTEVITLELYWHMFRQLYDAGPEVANLLHETAGIFFGGLRIMSLDNIVLRITKLTDPAKQGKYENAALYSLVAEIDPNNGLWSEINSKLKVLSNTCVRLRDIRDKIVSHHDAKTKLGKSTIASAPKKDFEDAIQLSKDVFNMACKALVIDEKYHLHEVVYQGTADELLRRLRESEKYRELISSGKIPYDS